VARTLEIALRCGALGADLRVTEATVVEAISRPTRAVVHAESPETLDGEAAVRAPAHLEISLDGEPVRHFHLVVMALQLDGLRRGGMRRYTIELAHELALLELRSDVRIFQEQDAQAIVQAVLDTAVVVLGDVTFSLQRTPVTRTYCVQYRETDFDFISRICEHEGIFYIIEDDASSARVTFADAQSVFQPIDGEPSLRLLDDDMHGSGIHDLAFETVATPERVTVGDYNFETPGVDLHATHAAAGAAAGDHDEFAAGHTTPDEGKVLAEIRCAELVSSRTVGRGASDRVEMRAGAWFELEQAARDAHNTKYLLHRVEHRFVTRASDRGEAGDAGETSEAREMGETYQNRFTCGLFEAPFRPPRITPRPRLRGVHSAVVTGPSGSEIHTEKLGRMKAKFPWDRLGKEDDTSSCWMRVVELPIGGSMALARVGWEMAVAYQDGDPDRPVAVARLYNAEKTSPYAFPAAKSRMSLQTPSSPGGGKSNEIRMEDGGGGMELFVNASKDADAQTNNNKTETIGVDEQLEVGVDSAVTIGASQSVTIGASETTQVSADMTVEVAGSRTKSVSASETVSVSGCIEVNVDGDDTETVGASRTTLAALGVDRSAQGSSSLTVGGSMISAAAAGVSVAVAGARSETVGGVKIVASGGAVKETVIGALASTVGGVCVQAASGHRLASTKGPAAITVGGLLTANAASKISIQANKVAIRVLGVANLVGGGGVLNLTPGSAAFVGLVTLDASGSITLSGNPNLVG
jgi:type VI secretion system secreted protein VgrG